MSERHYPLEEIGRLLIASGWRGQATRGWLFRAHVAVEGTSSTHPAAVLDVLTRLLGVSPDSTDAQRAAALIAADTAHAPRRRKDLDVVESAISWRAKHWRAAEGCDA